MLKDFFRKIPVFSPFVKYQIDNMQSGNFWLNNPVKRSVPIIISLYSCDKNFDKLPMTLYSLFNQSLKPDRIVLWQNGELYNLASLPYEITCFIQNGLEIRFVKDLGSYTKFIYAFKEFKNSIIVTAEDNVYYRKGWLEKLYYSYIANPDDIHVHSAHRVKTANGGICPFEKWKKYISSESADYKNFIVNSGGVLYPPNCFSNEVQREDIFLKSAPKTDDLWIWVMALLSKRKIRLVKNHYRHFFVTDLWDKSVSSKKEVYNNALQNLMKYYGHNIINKL